MLSLLTLLTTLLKFTVGISLIAGIHELGHLLLAKCFSMRVERYMIFFPPKLWSFHWGETEYGIGSIPLGGMVQIAGMEDEPLDTNGSVRPPQPREFRSKPAWQRLLVMAGGILFNLLLTFSILWGLTYWQDQQIIPAQVLEEHGLCPTERGCALGFKRGDRIKEVNGEPLERFMQIGQGLLTAETPTYQVMRDGHEVTITIPADELAIALEQGDPLLMPLVPFHVAEVIQNMGAEQAGLEPSDHIIAINGLPTPYLQDFQQAVSDCSTSALTLTYQRGEEVCTVQVVLDGDKKLGIKLAQELAHQYVRYSAGMSCIVATGRMHELTMLHVKGLYNLVRRPATISKSLQGPIGMAGHFAHVDSLSSFLLLIAILSLMIALMNLLPIPALDGGHLLLTLVEMVRGKPLPTAWHVRIQKVGVCLLLGLTLLAVRNDLYELLIKCC